MTRDNFWTEVPLAQMTRQEWEGLCDGCGKCCLNKLEDEDSGEVAYTRVACRLFDGNTCRCSDYAARLKTVPECIVLTPQSLPKAAYFMPETCAYRRLHEGKDLPLWHPLITGDPESTHQIATSVRGLTLPETEVAEDTWEDYLLAVET